MFIFLPKNKNLDNAQASNTKAGQTRGFRRKTQLDERAGSHRHSILKSHQCSKRQSPTQDLETKRTGTAQCLADQLVAIFLTTFIVNTCFNINLGKMLTGAILRNCEGTSFARDKEQSSALQQEDTDPVLGSLAVWLSASRCGVRDVSWVRGAESASGRS